MGKALLYCGGGGYKVLGTPFRRSLDLSEPRTSRHRTDSLGDVVVRSLHARTPGPEPVPNTCQYPNHGESLGKEWNEQLVVEGMVCPLAVAVGGSLVHIIAATGGITREAGRKAGCAGQKPVSVCSAELRAFMRRKDNES